MAWHWASREPVAQDFGELVMQITALRAGAFSSHDTWKTHKGLPLDREL